MGLQISNLNLMDAIDRSSLKCKAYLYNDTV